MLTIQELNIAVKFYAFNLPQRFQQLSHPYYPSLESDIDQQQLQLLALIDKYQNYVTCDERQLRLGRKLVERMFQIYDFFKNKSSNQNLLTIIHQKIQSEIDGILQKDKIDLGELFSFVHLIAKKGGMIKVPAQKKRFLSRSILKQPNKTQHKYSPTPSTHNIQRRTTNKHFKSSSFTTPKWKVDDLLNGPYSCLQIQRAPLTRIKQHNQQLVFKDMLKRNDKIVIQIRKEEKKWRNKVILTEPSECTGRESTILSQMKPNSIKNTWLKKKRATLLPRKRQVTLKQNISIYA